MGKKYYPFILTALLIAADQMTKLLVIKTIPLRQIGWAVGGDFFRIIHVRNLGVGFSIGTNLPDSIKMVLFIALPLVLLIWLGVLIVRTNEFTPFQRWLCAGIIGGGLGNQIDRIFRPGGVVDFLDVKFYGLFGMERWPTFNIADASVVVCGILMFISIIISEVQLKQLKKESTNE